MKESKKRNKNSQIMSNVSIITNKVVVNQTADMNTDTDSMRRTNDVNYNNRKVSATHNDQNDTTVVINNSANARNKHDKPKNTCQPPLVDVKNRNVTTNNEVALTRTITRNSCTSINGHNIAKSWYARCNRWRSQSCDRRKATTIRYSWNTNANRPV